MGRVSDKTVSAIKKFFSELPKEAKKKCSLCNETLVDIVKKAEAKTGAGTATVTRVLANEINEGELEHEQVSPEALIQRIRQKEGKNKSKIRNPNNRSEPDENTFTLNHVTENQALQKRKAAAIEFLGLDDYCDLGEHSPWPADLVSLLKRSLSKKYHPESGGSTKKFQKFNDMLQALEEDFNYGQE